MEEFEVNVSNWLIISAAGPLCALLGAFCPLAWEVIETPALRGRRLPAFFMLTPMLRPFYLQFVWFSLLAGALSMILEAGVLPVIVVMVCVGFRAGISVYRRQPW